MKSSKFAIQYVAGVVVAVFAVGILWSGDSVKAEWLRFYSYATLAAVAGLWLWTHWIWRWPLIQRMSAVPRCIRGTWKGEVRSFWVNPSTRETPPPKAVYLAVRQTSEGVTVRLLTDESSSSSALADVIKLADQTWALSYVYDNLPKLSVQGRSHPHHGSTVLAVVGSPVSRLRGKYWTDRDSKGELDFTQHAKEIVDDFDLAQDLFGDNEGDRGSDPPAPRE